jgi:hypothetical protein
MNSNSTTYKRFMQLKMITKYGIFSLAFLSLSYCILYFFLGVEVKRTYILYFLFAMILRVVLSRAFGLCWIHRACIIYNFLVSLSIVTDNETILQLTGFTFHQMMGTFSFIGLILFALVIWKVKIKKSC